ncbi:MAG: response regulator [Planctomycetes bacterium]|nr:response regulator [Planctomycetota bacterium]
MSTKRILIADDNRDIAHLLKLRLEAGGYEVIEAGDGMGCLARAFNERPDLILLDIGLPDLSGDRILETLKAMEGVREIPVVIQTGVDLEDGGAELRRRGAAALLKKPYNKRELLEAVDRGLHRQSHRAVDLFVD